MMRPDSVPPDSASASAATRSVRFELNGTPCALQLDESVTLLDALRTELGLTGTRFGCGAEQCGACHVMVDGRAQPSCALPLWAVAGKSIVTVEGLGDAAAPHPLQQAFLVEQAAQCGYCTSGMLVTAAALLDRVPNPSEAQVREALDRNLCRCGSHNRIVRAVLRAAGSR